MKKTNKPAIHPHETLMEKIGDTVSHMKDVIAEQKDHLVEAVSTKVVAVKKAIRNLKKKNKPAARKKASEKIAGESNKKISTENSRKKIKAIIGKRQLRKNSLH